MIRVRVDDYPRTSKHEPQHTRSTFRDFHRVLSEGIGGKRYLLGVVPGQCDPDDLLLIRNELDVVVGMHGTDHDEERLTRNGGNQFEPYLTANQISQALDEHRKALGSALGQWATVYMPPRNVIDERTVTAALACGFHYFTSGPETSADVRERHPLMFIHSEKPHEYGRSDEMFAARSHLTLAERAAEGRDITLCLHWTWETNVGLGQLRRFLNQIPKALFADFDG